MASVVITIETDGAAFRDGCLRTAEAREKISRILRHMANQYERCGMADAPRDINGNVVGKVEMRE